MDGRNGQAFFLVIATIRCKVSNAFTTSKLSRYISLVDSGRFLGCHLSKQCNQKPLLDNCINLSMHIRTMSCNGEVVVDKYFLSVNLSSECGINWTVNFYNTYQRGGGWKH
jgi:hypothetical protein